MEIWKDILELESLFQVSNFGNFKSKSRKVASSIQPSGFRNIKAKVVNLQDNGNGYKQIYVQINNMRIVILARRLIAIYFLENPEGHPEVNHLDGDKSNNNADNLKWVTKKENSHHAVKTGLIKTGADSVKSKLTVDNVACIKRLYKLNPKFNKLSVARKLGVRDSTIHKIIKNQRWKR